VEGDLRELSPREAGCNTAGIWLKRILSGERIAMGGCMNPLRWTGHKGVVGRS
jgi:hypothetical protein